MASAANTSAGAIPCLMAELAMIGSRRSIPETVVARGIATYCKQQTCARVVIDSAAGMN